MNVTNFNTRMHDSMTTKKQREIIVEFERIQLIRKRAKTNLARCERCGIDTDQVSLNETAELFEIPLNDLGKFIRQNDCHYNANGEVCLTSLLAKLQTPLQGGLKQLTGDTK